jgi:SNF family Na+-dependent transporter
VAEQPGPKKEQWASRIGVIMAVAGSAVGLGNFLRFPGQAVQNGGGAFMLPYFISLLVLGIPLCWAEWKMGRYAGRFGFNSAPGVYSIIWKHRAAKYLGGLALLIPLIIYMYYVLIEAWCLGYAFHYVSGELMRGKDPSAYQKFFASYAGTNADGFVVGSRGTQLLTTLLIVFSLNFFLIYRGITKGIEKFCRIAMPIMAVLGVIVLVRVMTISPPADAPDRTVLSGLGFMWNPHSEKLWEPSTWLAASGQIFFSLSVGFGIIVNYASYLRKDDDIALSGLTACSMNEFFEVCLGGLITIPAAFIFLGVAAGSQGTFGLGFNALPNVFAQMAGGRFFGFLWFFMLFVAAITSSVSMLQPVIAFLEEGFGLKRHASAAILGLISGLGCLFVLYFSKDMKALDTFDFWVGTFLIFVLALVQSILYGWVLGIERGNEEIHRGALIKVPFIVQLMLKYVVPVYLVAIFIGVAWTSIPSKNVDIPYKDKGLKTFKLDLPLSAFGVEATGPISAELATAFAAHGKELSEKGTETIQSGQRPSTWEIRDGEDHLLYVIESNEAGATVLEHKPGYVETIGNNPVALMSMFFILGVFVFLLLMIRIAGKRWEAQGRLKYE